VRLGKDNSAIHYDVELAGAAGLYLDVLTELLLE
jgi:hypothetical protein